LGNPCDSEGGAHWYGRKEKHPEVFSGDVTGLNNIFARGGKENEGRVKRFLLGAREKKRSDPEKGVGGLTKKKHGGKAPF